jgi:predicted esterase
MQPHANGQILQAGVPLEKSKAVMLMIHGRGATAQSILELAQEFAAEDITYLAPQASGNTWYPYSFLAPTTQNEPGLSSGLWVIDQLVAELGKRGKTTAEILLLGFSQGACLALEYAARNARQYAGVIGLSGGLIGQSLDRSRYPGTFPGTPVFLGCSDIDSHVPMTRVQESSVIFREMGATVTERIYPGMGHTVNEDEISFVNALLNGIPGKASKG